MASRAKPAPVHTPSLEEQIGGRCRHFNGVMNDACRAGVDYETVGRPLPCLKRYGGEATECALREWFTDAEVAAKVAAIHESGRQFAADLVADICPRCKTPISRKQQVGRCVYAEPCGCRLYQGRA